MSARLEEIRLLEALQQNAYFDNELRLLDGVADPRFKAIEENLLLIYKEMAGEYQSRPENHVSLTDPKYQIMKRKRDAGYDRLERIEKACQ